MNQNDAVTHYCYAYTHSCFDKLLCFLKQSGSKSSVTIMEEQSSIRKPTKLERAKSRQRLDNSHTSCVGENPTDI